MNQNLFGKSMQERKKNPGLSPKDLPAFQLQRRTLPLKSGHFGEKNPRAGSVMKSKKEDLLGRVRAR